MHFYSDNRSAERAEQPNMFHHFRRRQDHVIAWSP
jgi:hypothetical protein